MKYFIGDSHGHDLYQEKINSFKEVQFKASFGNKAIFCDPWHVNEKMEKFINELPSGSNLLISMTDCYTREVLTDKDRINPKHVIDSLKMLHVDKINVTMLDCFAVSKNPTTCDQNSEPKHRAINRKILNNILKNNINFVSFEDLIDDEHGFVVDERILKDGCHFNYNTVIGGKLIGDCIVERLKKFLD